MKLPKIILSILLLTLMLLPIKADAQTLRDLKDQLTALEQKKANADNEKKLTEQELHNINLQIESTSKKITESEENIKKLNNEIIELNEKAKQKELEIKEVIHFLQIANGENAYLEYIFGAKDITDFIYRSAISGQLVDYNEKLIKEYNDTIEENKKKQEKLKIEMENLAKKQEEMKVTLKALGSQLASMSEVSMSIEEELKNLKDIIKYYEVDMKCDMDQDITSCGNKVPYSGSFVRPVTNGRITSVFGWRCYTRNNGQYYCGMHNGIDISGGDTRIYAAAPGIVVAIENGAAYKQSTGKYFCGGNKVYIVHNVGGNKFTTAYFHLKDIRVNIGAYVDQNTQIATMGGGPDTWWYDNCTTGQHLHFSVTTGNYLRDRGYSYYSQFEANNINPTSVVNFPAPGVWFSNRITRY